MPRWNRQSVMQVAAPRVQRALARSDAARERKERRKQRTFAVSVTFDDDMRQKLLADNWVLSISFNMDLATKIKNIGEDEYKLHFRDDGHWYVLKNATLMIAYGKANTAQEALDILNKYKGD